ncbi:MAG: hypothetical protein RIT04_39 [Candidatus Parcubacteria bacterium]|jgi:virulence-associated protein VagC
MQKFNKRWSITSVDSYEVAFRKFKTRILNIFKDIDGHVTNESITAFCQYYGIEEIWHTQAYGERSWSTNIMGRLSQESDEKEFYRLIELLFSLDIESTIGYRGYECTYSKDILFHSVQKAVELSDVNVSITASDGEIILYPKGEKILDEELVDSPLSFLNKESAEHFIQALQFYQSKKHIKSAESLRRSLEEFLRFKLKNSKGLNANITELQLKLKSDKKDAQVRNIVHLIFSYLDQYFNDNSKHNDGDIDDLENEFLIYQIGLLLKYLNKSI